MTIGAKITSSDISSNVTKQAVPFWRLHARVFGGVIRQFCGKTETRFITTHSNICISHALCRRSDDFHSTIGRNRFKF